MHSEGTSPREGSGAAEARIVTVLVSLLALGLVDAQLLAPILAAVAGSLDVSERLIGGTVSGYALSAALAALVIGPLSDAKGRRLFLTAGAFGLALGSALVARAEGFLAFAAARVLTGAAAGVLSALVIATIADVVPYERRGRAMGWVAAAYFAAPILGIPVASWIADRYGWRVNYLGFVVLAIALGLTVAFAIPETSPGRVVTRPRFASHLRHLRRRSTAAGALSAFFVTGGLTGFLLFLGAYLQHRFGLSLTQVGLVFLLSGSASLAGALGAGRLSDRVGKLPVAVGGSLALALVLAAVPFGEGPLLYALLGGVGLAAASRVAPLQSLVTQLVGAEDRGAYVALRNTLSQCGNAAAAALAAMLYPLGFHYVCWLTAGFSAAAVGLLLLIEEPSTDALDATGVSS